MPADVIQGLNRKAHEFFALPMEEKQEVMPADIKSPRGYKPVGYEALGHGNANMTPPDLKEYYHLGRETLARRALLHERRGPALFHPQRVAAPARGLRARPPTATTREMERLVGDLMRVVALGLGIDEHFFDDKIDKHITAMRLNFYPEVKEPPKPGQLRGGEHTDYGLLTILNGENVPGGLQVQTAQGAVDRRGDRPEQLRVQHRRSADALDQRPLGVERAPGGDAARQRRRRQAAVDGLLPPPQLRRG